MGRHTAFPVDYLLNVIFQKFNGLSLNGSASFNAANIHGLNYIPTAVYVGVIGIVLAAAALVTIRRRPAIVAFGAVVAVSACLVYLSPLVALLNRLPILGEVRWVRAIQMLGFGLAILAGAGLDALARSRGDRRVRNCLGVGFGAAALLILLVWLFGRGHLSAVDATIRSRSFVWPAAETVLGLTVFGFLVVMARRGRAALSRLGDPSRVAAAFLLLASTVFLAALGAPWWPSSTSYLKPTRAETTLQKAVGTSMVGFGTGSCWYPPTLGIQPNVNIVYGVHELNVYDPLTPQELYTAWTEATGLYPRPVGIYAYTVPISMFCPVVKSVATARLFGVGFVLEPHGAKGPPGSVFVKQIGTEELYRIPGAAAATLSALGVHGSLPEVDAPGQPVAVTYPDAASWKLVTHAARPQVLRLRLTDVPGWHATIDGKPLTLVRFNRIMLQARIPAGRHTIELHYWPDTFNAGLVLAGGTAVVLVVALVFGGRWSRKRRAPAGAVGAP